MIPGFRSGTSNLIVFLAVLFFSTFIIPILPFQDPLLITLDEKLLPPSIAHPFGTDDLGRDLLSRVFHGYSTTIRVSIFAILSSLGIGMFVGSLAGYYYRTWLDNLFNWLVSLVFSLPFLLVMGSIMSLINPSILNAYIILSLLMWVNPARIVRAEVISIKNLDHITALKAFGASDAHILIRTILPVSVPSAFIFSVSYLPEIIGLEAGLSFLGLGVQPPNPGLGKMIFDGLKYIYSAWWFSFFPALILFGIVFLINFFIRDIKN